jgi:signal transduction histidine kinase
MSHEQQHKTPTTRWLALVLLALCAALAFSIAQSHATTQAPSITWIKRAVLRDQAAAEVKLPLTIPAAEVNPISRRLLLELTLDLPEKPSETLSVYIQKLSVSGSLSVNGQFIQNCAPGALKNIRCLHQPTLFVAPAHVWKKGRNTLVVELLVNNRQTVGLTPAAVGPSEVIYRQLYLPRHTATVFSLQALTWIGIYLFFMLLALALMLPGERYYLHFATAVLVNSLSNLNGLVQTPPVSEELWALFVFSTRMISAPLIMLSVLSFYGVRWAPATIYLKLFCLVAPLVILVSGSNKDVVAALHISNLGAGLILLLLTPYWSWKNKDWREIGMCASYYLIGAAAIADWVKLIGPARFDSVYLVPYASAGSLIFMSVLLVSRLVESLRSSRELALTLEQKVADREAQLLTMHQERVAHELHAEREKLLRDVHDGLGSSLSSTMLALKISDFSTSQVAEMLGECVDDLRLLLATTQSGEGLLSNTLADLRYRMDKRLHKLGIHPVWTFELKNETHASTHTLLQLMRIVQEALHNVIKHSRATHVQVYVQWGPQSLVLSVTDNGNGLGPSASEHQGQGTANMLARAQSLGAELSIHRSACGTAVVLKLNNSLLSRRSLTWTSPEEQGSAA